MTEIIKALIEEVRNYPCHEPYHEFQIIDPMKGICKCLYCLCQTTVVVADLYHEWKKKEKQGE